MIQEYWIEIKRTDFLSAIQAVKPTLRVKSAPERDLEIGLVNGQAIFSVQGASASKPAKGNWPGIARIRLAYFLTFLIAKPDTNLIRISIADNKIKVDTARFPANWVDSHDNESIKVLAEHKKMPPKENIMKFNCPKCKRKQGVALESLGYGALNDIATKHLISTAEKNGDGFGCLRCGATWDEQLA